MSEKPISPLRRRMLDDMTVRRFTPDTQRDYIRAVKKLTAFIGRSPDRDRRRTARLPAPSNRQRRSTRNDQRHCDRPAVLIQSEP
jgi:hypothetical protein